LSGQRSDVIRVNRRNVIRASTTPARRPSSQFVHHRETARRLPSQYRRGRLQAVRTTAVAAASRLHRRTRHRRRGHHQATRPPAVHSTGDTAVSRPHAHVAAAVRPQAAYMSARRDPLNYHTSTERSPSTCRHHRRTLSSAPRATTARRTPSRDRRARHSATSSTAPGARLQGAKGTPNIIPLRDRRSKKIATRGNRRA